MLPTEIVKNLFIGDQKDAETWPYSRICVIEYKEECGLKTNRPDFWIPLLEGHVDEEHVPERNLDKVADKIEEELKKGIPLIVQCWLGIERSPLATAWYLHKYRGMSLEDAYKLIQSKRHIVQDRRVWIRPNTQLSDTDMYNRWKSFNE